jgi:hypothetical protein
VTDRVFIRHPDQPERNGYVTQTAFDALWSKKGFVIDDPDQVTSDDLNAELDRRAGVEPDPPAEPVAGEEPDAPDDSTPDDEKGRLAAQLEAAGITVDGRWGLKRLRTEAANLATDEDFD